MAAATALLVGCGGMNAGHPNSTGSAALAASSPSLSFGSVTKTKRSNLTETLTNTGATAVTISDATVSGTGFSVSGLNMPMTLAANERVTLTVTFAPAAAGSASGTLAVVSTATNSPLNIALSGAGADQPQLTVSPTALSFGNVAVGGNTSLPGTLSAAGGSVTISSASSNSSEFVLSGISLPATLDDGQSANFSVTFKPAAAGTVSATVGFSSDAAVSPAKQNLTGTGTSVIPHSVTLNWDASTAAGVVGYNVYRGNASGGPYSMINSSLEAGTSYADGAVINGHTYYYVITAVDGSGEESAYSNQAKAVVPAS